MSSTKNILMIVTSHDRLGATGQKTGFWLEELAAPYLEFVRSGAHVDLASPKGGRPPTDPKSETNPAAAVKEFLADPKAVAKLESTIRIAEVARTYDAYFVVGGHGVMWDLAEDSVLHKLLADAFENGHTVAAVCHGPAALVGVRLRNGEALVAGRRVAGFSNEEEAAVKLTETVPFALETRLRELGGLYERGPMWGSFVVRDGRLITGQNPASSAAVARETLAALAGGAT
jgi:putative intracellular protease/amidase